MTRKLSTIYAGRVIVNAANPNGTFKNEVTPGVSGDGTPNDEKWAQDHRGFLDHTLKKAGLTHNGAQENEDDSQYYDALLSRIVQPLLNSNRILLTWNASGTEIDFSAAVMVFDDGSGFAPTPAYTKLLSGLSAWAAGDTNEGLDTGALTFPTWYFCYAIYNPTTKLADYLFTANLGSPALPAGYTKKEYIGAVYRETLALIRRFIQTGNQFNWYDIVFEFTILPPMAPTPSTVTIPNSIALKAIINAILNVPNIGGVNGIVYPPIINDPAPSITLNTLAAAPNISEIANFTGAILANSISQIKMIFDAQPAGSSITLNTVGWVDLSIRG